MSKGKRGPRPEIEITAQSEIMIEESFLGDELEALSDPEIEDIIGEENVVDVGEAITGMAEQQTAERQGYKCIEVGCTFQTCWLSEIEEHNAAMGHGGYVTETLDPLSATQPELFSEPGTVHRNIEVPMDPNVLNEKRVKLAELYQQALEVKGSKKYADAQFNAQLTAIDEDMQAIARVLKQPFTYTKVDCEWRIIDGENARGLYRIDTGEQIELAALTEEDRVKEVQQAEEANRTVAAEVFSEDEEIPEVESKTDAAEMGSLINKRAKRGSKTVH